MTDREVERLRQAIRNHRDQRGDDRCWLDDEELYKALPEGYTPPPRSETVELDCCRRYIATRHHPGTVYISPQRRIEQLEDLLKRVVKELAEHNAEYQHVTPQELIDEINVALAQRALGQLLE
jgi:hypothetical protein